MKLLKYVLCAAMLCGAAPSRAQSWCSGGPLSIGAVASPAAPYPSTITVSGAAPNVANLSIAINGLTHVDPGDLDLLLVGPGGQKMVIQSDAGNSAPVVGRSYVISDTGAAALPDAAPLTTNTWAPANYAEVEAFPSPAPAGPYAQPAPAGAATLASVFVGTNPNGTWSLYVNDDDSGEGGQIFGWCLRLGAPLKISEFRLSGANGVGDEFIEVLNDSPTPTTVISVDGTAGFAIVASDGITRCIIPNGTVIGPYRHFLCTNSSGYSLAGYAAGAGSTATGDATYVTGIADGAGVALFRTALGGAAFSLSNRLDAVGSSAEANPLYREGAGYTPLSAGAVSTDHSLARDTCGKRGVAESLSSCQRAGFAADSNDNANDFVFQDTNGTSPGAGSLRQRLGAPGPENLGSPGRYGLPLTVSSVDACVPRQAPPNAVRDFTSNPPANSTFGTVAIRRTITNNTEATITRLRYRVADITTFAVIPPYAELRARSASNTVVPVDRPPCNSGITNLTVTGAVLEMPPAQSFGGGQGTTFSIPLGNGLAPGASIDVQFLFGVQSNGLFKFELVPEASPAGGGYFDTLSAWGCTDGCSDLIFRNGLDL